MKNWPQQHDQEEERPERTPERQHCCSWIADVPEDKLRQHQEGSKEQYAIPAQHECTREEGKHKLDSWIKTMERRATRDKKISVGHWHRPFLSQPVPGSAGQ